MGNGNSDYDNMEYEMFDIKTLKEVREQLGTTIQELEKVNDTAKKKLVLVKKYCEIQDIDMRYIDPIIDILFTTDEDKLQTIERNIELKETEKAGSEGSDDV